MECSLLHPHSRWAMRGSPFSLLKLTFLRSDLIIQTFVHDERGDLCYEGDPSGNG